MELRTWTDMQIDMIIGFEEGEQKQQLIIKRWISDAGKTICERGVTHCSGMMGYAVGEK